VDDDEEGVGVGDGVEEGIEEGWLEDGGGEGVDDGELEDSVVDEWSVEDDDEVGELVGGVDVD